MKSVEHISSMMAADINVTRGHCLAHSLREMVSEIFRSSHPYSSTIYHRTIWPEKAICK